MPTWIAEMFLSKAFWICVGLAGLVAGGWYVKGVFDERARLEKENDELKAAAKTTRALQDTADQDASDFVKETLARSEANNERQRKLEAQLAASGHALAGCHIDVATLQLLNDEKSGTAEPVAEPRPGPASVEAGATCEDLARSYNENHETYNQTAAQVQALRKFYNDVRLKYCADTGAC